MTTTRPHKSASQRLEARDGKNTVEQIAALGARLGEAGGGAGGDADGGGLVPALVAPLAAEEAAAEAELLRLCLTNARDAAWAEWFYEHCFTHPKGKVAGLAFYRAYRANSQERTP